jgi:hypothetical protein
MVIRRYQYGISLALPPRSILGLHQSSVRRTAGHCSISRGQGGLDGFPDGFQIDLEVAMGDTVSHAF